MRGRRQQHAPGEVWDAGGVGAGGRARHQDGLPVAHWHLPHIPSVSQGHHQEHQDGMSTKNKCKISVQDF